MNIWIMRHGEAGFDAPTDSERTLTEKGKNAAFLQGKWLGEQCIPRNIHFANITEEWNEITPSGSPDLIQDYLAFLNEEGAKQVLIVSHLPLVFDLVQTFTQHQQSVHFYPAVIAEIHWNGTKGVLLQEKIA